MDIGSTGLLLLHVLLAGAVVLCFFHLRLRFGLTVLVALLAALQPLMVVLSAGAYVEVFDGLLLSPASVAWFPAGIMAVLLVYLRDDAVAVRQMVYGLVLANMVVGVLFLLLPLQVPLVEGGSAIAGLLDRSPRVTVAGTVMLLVDVLLVMPVYEWLGRLRLGGTVRIAAALGAVLVVDSIGFALLGFLGTPLFLAVLGPGAVAKVLAGALLALLAAAYLTWLEPIAAARGRGAAPLDDVFDALSYRQRYELQQAVAEDAVRSAAEVHRQLLDATTDAVLALDGRGVVVDANAEALRLIGCERAELLGTDVRTWLSAVGLDEALAASPAPAQPDAAPLREHLDAVLAEDAGYRRHLELWVTPLPAGVGAVRAMLALRDVSDRNRHFQQQLHASRMDSLGRLAGGVAHDFNNLLTVIMSGASLIELGEPDPTVVRRQAKLVREAAERGSRLTSQLLSYARKELLPPAVVDVDALVRGVQPLVERLLGEEHTFVFEPGEATWPVWISPDQLEQVLLNLSTNARDAMPDGGEVVVRTGRRTVTGRRSGLDPGDYCVVSVEDTGSGIRKEDLPRIFDPFYTTKAVDQGTGLGLSMCLGIAEQAGGGLLIDSTPGEGTRALVLLPRTEQAATAPVEPVVADPATAAGAAVLVVDDDASVAEVVRLTLQAAGHRVQVVHGPEAALEHFAAGHTVDLLVSDIVMPGMRGDQMVRELAARGHRPPVVFLTGHATGVALDVEALGGHPLLHKPFRARELIATATRVLADADALRVAGG